MKSGLSLSSIALVLIVIPNSVRSDSDDLFRKIMAASIAKTVCQDLSAPEFNQGGAYDPEIGVLASGRKNHEAMGLREQKCKEVFNECWPAFKTSGLFFKEYSPWDSEYSNADGYSESFCKSNVNRHLQCHPEALEKQAYDFLVMKGVVYNDKYDYEKFLTTSRCYQPNIISDREKAARKTVSRAVR
jgi:hypothetical protein